MPFALAGKRINYKLRCFECNLKEPTNGLYLCGTCIKSKASKIKELQYWCYYLSQVTAGTTCSYQIIDSVLSEFNINYSRAGFTGQNSVDYEMPIKTRLLVLLGYPTNYNIIKKPYKRIDGSVGDIIVEPGVSPDFFIPQGSNAPASPPETIVHNGYTWYISKASEKAFKKAGFGRKSKKNKKKGKSKKKLFKS